MVKNSEEFNQIFLASFLRKLQKIRPLFTFWHTPNGGSRNKAEAGRLKLMGVLAGIPDIAIMSKGVLRFIELKVGNGKLSDGQVDFIKSAEAYGFTVDIIKGDCPKEVIDLCAPIMASIGYHQNEISSAEAGALGSKLL